MTTNDDNEQNRPTKRLRVERIHASIWENPGKHGPRYSATFERRYRDEQDQWQSSTSFDARDLLALSKAADLAHTAILELRASAGDEAA